MKAKPELEELYRRAAADPRSISRAEHNAIWGYPPPDEEDRLCVAKTGHTRAELVAKALARPQELTLAEAVILNPACGVEYEVPVYDGGAGDLARFDMLLAQFGEELELKSTPLQKLLYEALDQLATVRSPDEVTAVGNAIERKNAIEVAESEAMDVKVWEMEKSRRLKVGTPWMRAMLRAGLLEDGAECWGFVVFRTGCYYQGEAGEAAWQRFREYLRKVAETSVMHWYSGPELRPSLRVFFVEDKELEGASDVQLRERFGKMRDGTSGGEVLPKGIRTNCFLVADEPIIKSKAAQTPYEPRYWDSLEMSFDILDEDPVVYIRAVDPDYVTIAALANTDAVVVRKDGEDEMADFRGEATVALPRVFDWLHCVCFFAERGITPTWGFRNGWSSIYVQTKRPEVWVRNWSPRSGGISYT